MSDAARQTTADPKFVIDLRGNVSGMVAAGEFVYQQQVNVSDGGLVYVLEEGTVPYRRVPPPVRLLPRADPPLLDRIEETAASLGAIRPGGTVRVTGAPGAGKSLFLTHLAHGAMPPALDDGVVHLRGGGHSMGDLAFQLFYAFHDSQLPTAFVPPPPQIKRALAGVTAVVLIDDTDAVDDLAGLMDLAVDCAFVVTSSALDPAGVSSVTVGSLPADAAAALFARASGLSADSKGVEALCGVLDGHAQCIVFAAELVRLEAVAPADLVTGLHRADACATVARRLLSALPGSDARAARYLAAFDGAPVPADRVAAATGDEDVSSALARLSAASIAPSNSPTYAFSPLLLEAAEEVWDLESQRRSAVAGLTAWLGAGAAGADAVEAAPMVLEAMDWTASTEYHDEAVKLASGIEGPLALAGMWGSWERALRTVRSSALDTGDDAALGWALHQLGTRALCLGDRSSADQLLRQALSIRESVGVQSAIETTRHNLDLLMPPGSGSDPAEPEPEPPGGLPAPVKWLGAVLLIAGVVAAGWAIYNWLFDGRGLLTAEPTRLSYSMVLGDPVTLREVLIGNEGDAAAPIDAIAVEGDAFWLGDATSCNEGLELEPGAGCVITVAFDPPDSGNYDGTLLVSDPDGVVTIDLDGEALAFASLEADPSSIEFEEVEAGTTATQLVRFTNTGGVPNLLETFFFETGLGYAVGDEDCLPELDAGASCTVEIRFTPPIQSEYPDRLVLTHQGADGATTVELFGTAFGSADLSASPPAIDFGPVRAGEDQFAETLVTNTGTASAPIGIVEGPEYPFSIVGDECDGELGAGGGCVITIRFNDDRVPEAGIELRSIARQPVIPVSTSHAEIIVVEGGGGQRIEIPLTAVSVIPLPDLTSRIDMVEQRSFDQNDFPVFHITATIENIGGERAGSSRIAVRFDVGGESHVVPLLDDAGVPVETGDIGDLGGVVTIDGFGVIPMAGMAGSDVSVLVAANACLEEQNPVAMPCIQELNTVNNVSEPFETTVPFLIFMPPFDLYDITDLFDIDFIGELPEDFD